MNEVADLLDGGTLDHIDRLTSKIETLQAALDDARAQFCHRTAASMKRGEVTQHDLPAIYSAYREATHRAVGFAKAWDAAIPVTAGALNQSTRHGRATPNGPEGTFVGAFPLDQWDPAPLTGASVVYILFDAMNVPCYVGSTKAFRERLKAHTDKAFTNWQAFPCADREDAYDLEVKLLRERKPYLNQRVGR
jgi:hypothetical protein